MGPEARNAQPRDAEVQVRTMSATAAHRRRVAASRRTSSLASHVAADLQRHVTVAGASPALASKHLLVVETPDAWEAMVGTELGPGDWVTVDQTRVDAFADCTGDHQWIHKAGAKTAFGGPVVHGMLTVSLLPALLGSGVMPKHAWMGHELNCGFNRVRFTAPVPVGSNLRASAKLVRVRRLGGDGSGREQGRKVGLESVFAVTVHCRAADEVRGGREEEGKTALVAEWVTRQLQ